MNDSEQSRALKGLRVLIVEDEAPIALQVEDMLVESECEVVGPASRVTQALKLLDERPVDAAVLDLNIAGDMVYPVADALDKRGLPYLFATGYAASSLSEPYQARRVLQKPFSRRELLRAIQDVLDASETGNQS